MRIFTSKGEELDNATSHKLLGVYVDQDLSFNEYAEQLCRKLTKRIGLLRSIRLFLPLNDRIIFFTTHLKCNRRIFRLQKKAARVILSLKSRDQRTATLCKRLD